MALLVLGVNLEALGGGEWPSSPLGICGWAWHPRGLLRGPSEESSASLLSTTCVNRWRSPQRLPLSGWEGGGGVPAKARPPMLASDPSERAEAAALRILEEPVSDSWGCWLGRSSLCRFECLKTWRVRKKKDIPGVAVPGWCKRSISRLPSILLPPPLWASSFCGWPCAPRAVFPSATGAGLDTPSNSENLGEALGVSCSSTCLSDCSTAASGLHFSPSKSQCGFESVLHPPVASLA